MLTTEQERFFSTSDQGFKLDDKHFVAVFKTKLLQYKDFVVSENGWGNIISYTSIFPAVDKADAEQKALSHFHLFNPTFSPFKIECMKVEHTLIEVQEIIPPKPNGDFRHIHKFTHSPANWMSHSSIKVHNPKEEPIPKPYMGENAFWIRRIQKHLDSRIADAYLCHPRGGSSDTVIDWWRIEKGDGQFDMMAKLFVADHRFFSNRFYLTEYTSLSVTEQKLVKNKLKLDYLDNQQAHYVGWEDLGRRHLCQGRYLVQKTYKGDIADILFREDESNWLRRCYVKGNDRKIELRKKLQELELQKNLVNSEIKRIKKSLEEE